VEASVNSSLLVLAGRQSTIGERHAERSKIITALHQLKEDLKQSRDICLAAAPRDPSVISRPKELAASDRMSQLSVSLLAVHYSIFKGRLKYNFTWPHKKYSNRVQYY